MQVQAAGHRFDADSTRVPVLPAGARRRARGARRVTSAAFTSQLPLSGDLDEYGVAFEDAPVAGGNEGSALRYAVSPDYFDDDGHSAARWPPARCARRGRRARGRGDQRIVRQAAVSAGADAIGQRLRLGPEIGMPNRPRAFDRRCGGRREADVAGGGRSRTRCTWRRRSGCGWTARSRWWSARAAMRPRCAPSVKRAVWSVDKDQPIVRVATMDGLLARVGGGAAVRADPVRGVRARRRWCWRRSGIYGVLSGSVAERTREIGVRVGARRVARADILGLVMRAGDGADAASGWRSAWSGAVVASRALVTLLFGVSRLDPVDLRGRDRAAGRRVGRGVLDSGGAGGARGSGDHAARRVTRALGAPQQSRRASGLLSCRS